MTSQTCAATWCEQLKTYQSAEGAETEADLLDVPGLEQVHRLEDLVIGNSKFLHELLEGSVVLHQLEIAALLVDPFHTAWHVLVC